MGYTTDSFLKAMRPYVVRDMRNSGILASLTMAQAKIESNNGNSGLTQKANNLFGIKGSYKGQSITMKTCEYVNGVKEYKNQPFRKYPSWQESVNDHSDLFNRAARYKNLRNCQDYVQACTNVRKDGYCTAPEEQYINSLITYIKKHRLWMLDYEVLKDYPVNKLNTVKKGSKGAGAYFVQLTLTDKGYSLVCDGDFGIKTEEAVKAYQRENQLKDDGIVGQKTWKKLRG